MMPGINVRHVMYIITNLSLIHIYARYMLGMKVKDIAAMEGITPSQAGKSIHAALPVSYTHLDVYKRQVFRHIFQHIGKVTHKAPAAIRQLPVFIKLKPCLLYTSRCV